MLQQLRDVLAPAAHRRYRNADHVQPVQQVLAEETFLHAALEILVGGGDHAHVHLHRQLAADAIELALGQHAQQPGLQLRRHVADLVEEQRAAVGLLEAPAPQLRRAGERTLLVTEQLRLEQVGGERRGVERDERLGRARTVPMQRPRHELLARAGLAGDQHGHARTRQSPDRAEDLLHRRRVAEHLRDAARFARGGLRAMNLRRGAAHQLDRLVDVERLRQVFERAALVRRDGAVEIGVRRHHDHRQSRPLAADLLEQVEAAAAGHADVGHEHVRLLAAERGKHRVGVVERRRLHAALPEGPLEHPADRRVVVDDPDVKRFR